MTGFRPGEGLKVVCCPRCGAGQGESCRTLTSNRVTDHHYARWNAWFTAGRPAAPVTEEQES